MLEFLVADTGSEFFPRELEVLFFDLCFEIGGGGVVVEDGLWGFLAEDACGEVG